MVVNSGLSFTVFPLVTAMVCTSLSDEELPFTSFRFIEVMAFPTVTVHTAVLLLPSAAVAVIFTVPVLAGEAPVDTALTSPFSTVAMEVSELDQVTDGSASAGATELTFS